MPDLQRFMLSPAPNWIMTVVSVLMLWGYAGRVELVDNSRHTAIVALAWAIMLGIWLATALCRTLAGRTRTPRD